MFPPYIKLRLPQGGTRGILLPSFSISAILYTHLLVTAEKVFSDHTVINDIRYLYCRRSFVVSPAVLLGTIVGFFPLFLYFGDEHDTLLLCSLQMKCIFHSVFLCPAHSLLCIFIVGSFPVQSGGLLKNFLVP